MRYLSSIFAVSASAVLAFLASAPQGAVATDNMVEIQYPKQNPVEFCNKWRCNCVNYQPKDTSLYFLGTICTPGNNLGQYNQTEAKAFCLFTDGTKDVAVDHHIAAASGATIGWTQEPIPPSH